MIIPLLRAVVVTAPAATTMTNVLVKMKCHGAKFQEGTCCRDAQRRFDSLIAKSILLWDFF
jgi:hypothetical protein